MLTYHITDIEWDATEEDIMDNSLPSEVTITSPNDVDLDSTTIEDYLSDKYGFCVNCYYPSLEN